MEFSASLFLARSSRAATGTIKDVQHVVIFMQENRSFDEYFGTYKGARGFADRTALVFQNGHTVFYQPDGSSYVLPFHSPTECLNDVAHDWLTTHAAWDLGRWDQWVLAKGTTALTYFTRADLDYYYALADSYTLCDAFFCSVLGPTNPNRLYSMTGMIDPNGTAGGPAINNNEPGFSWTTYPERLQKAGVSWRIYQESDNFDDNALAWFDQYRNANPGSVLYDRGIKSVGSILAAFQNDVTSNQLPQVSWIIAPTLSSEHPPYSPANGASLTRQLLSALMSNSAVYNSTVFILTYDENGGFFDHIPAPVPPPGTPDEFVDGLPIGLGPRVPTIIVSPWTRGGFICSRVFDHTSVLRFLEKWTGVAEPNISAWRRAVCGDLTEAFDFAHQDTTLPSLPSVTPIVCSQSIDPPVPSSQTVPVSEAGTSKSRPLPYQLTAWSDADCLLDRFHITLTNAGSALAHVVVYANAFRSDGPWQYDVPAGGAISDYFNAGLFGGGKYDLTAYGPNGFQGRFAGDLNVLCNELEASVALDPALETVTLQLRNSTAAAVTFNVNINGGGPWNYSVPKASTFSVPIQISTNGNSYGTTVKTPSDTAWIRHFAGHLETVPKNLKTKLSFTISSATIHLMWNASPALKLQESIDLNSGSWSDVPGTLGASSADLPLSNSGGYFRVAQ